MKQTTVPRGQHRADGVAEARGKNLYVSERLLDLAKSPDLNNVQEQKG